MPFIQTMSAEAALVLTGDIELLPKLFEHVLAPQAVRAWIM
jgi:hypothetical protein